jgi:anti-sigma-K factor RskA
MERTHEELRELIAPYVLGAVDEDEAADIRSHVLSCEECMAAAENLSAAASALAVSVDPMPLPSGFEAGVVDRIHAESEPDRAPVRRPSRWRIFAPALGAAALVVAIAVLAVSLVNARDELSQEREVIASLLQSDEGTRLEGEGTARMVPTDGGGVFAAAGLDEAPDDHIYQVWLMDEACAAGEFCEPVSAGTFDVEDGVGLLEVDRPVEDFAAFAVTLEEGDGSDRGPTTDPILSSL